MAKYHIGKDGTPKRCRATKACPYGAISDHFNTIDEGMSIADDLNEQLQSAQSFGIIEKSFLATKIKSTILYSGSNTMSKSPKLCLQTYP